MRALFVSKLAAYEDRKGQTVEVLDYIEGMNWCSDRYVIRFDDGLIMDDVMPPELDFGGQGCISQRIVQILTHDKF